MRNDGSYEPMDATGQARQARAFGWELAELMLDALSTPASGDEAEALGRHAAEVIEERARSLAADKAEDETRLWADAACWGFRDRMAIAKELAGPAAEPPRASASVQPPALPHAGVAGAEGDASALRLIGGRDRAAGAEAASDDGPAAATPRAKPAKDKAKRPGAKPKRRSKPVPIP